MKPRKLQNTPQRRICQARIELRERRERKEEELSNPHKLDSSHDPNSQISSSQSDHQAFWDSEELISHAAEMGGEALLDLNLLHSASGEFGFAAKLMSFFQRTQIDVFYDRSWLFYYYSIADYYFIIIDHCFLFCFAVIQIVL